MEALVRAAPEAVRFEKGKKSVAAMFPEFRAWHALLEPLFGVQPPEWKEKAPPKDLLTDLPEPEQEGLGEDLDEEEEGQGDEE
jgi:hypothetical protein